MELFVDVFKRAEFCLNKTARRQRLKPLPPRIGEVSIVV
jgi:hypothetical protein